MQFTRRRLSVFFLLLTLIIGVAWLVTRDPVLEPLALVTGSIGGILQN